MLFVKILPFKCMGLRRFNPFSNDRDGIIPLIRSKTALMHIFSSINMYIYQSDEIVILRNVLF